MRDLAEAGLNLENCESWFERAVVASVGLMGVLLVIRVSVLVLSDASLSDTSQNSSSSRSRFQITTPNSYSPQ
jgi:hypothetical protein